MASETAPRPGPLAGVRVVDLSRVLAGPLCTQMLADHGAEVIKVEAPTGDETRTWGPPFVSSTSSAYYQALNGGKANIVLDLSSERGQQALADLLQDADVLVENFRTGTLARWGFDDVLLEQRHPRLIHCRISGFGEDGPMGGLPGYDAAAQAYSGLMSVNGEPDGAALRVGVPVVDMTTGHLAFGGVLLALLERARSGRGQRVECTLLDSALSLLHPHSAAYLADGTDGRRTGSAHPTIAPYDTFSAADGPVFIGAGNDHQFRALLDVLDLTHLSDDPRFTTNRLRVRHATELKALLEQATRQRARDALVHTLLGTGVPASPINTVAEALQDAHVVHRARVLDHDGYRGIATPMTLARTPARPRDAPREAGADTRRILADLGYSPARIDQILDKDAEVHRRGSTPTRAAPASAPKEH